MESDIVSIKPPGADRPAARFKLQQLCPSLGAACGVAVFAGNLERALRQAGVEVETIRAFDSPTSSPLLVQHEFGLFNTQALRSALENHRGPVALFAHSPGTEVFADVVDAHVALHEGMAKTDKPSLILPHPGWRQPLIDRAELKARFGWTGYRCVLGTNGFISPSRRFDRVASGLIDFAARHDVLIHLACPRHATHDNRPGYRDQEERLRRLAAKHPRNLELDSRFLEHESLNERLQACDLLWCWTETPSSPYGSGACSDQYASGTRLVVARKLQHSHVFGLPNVVVAPCELSAFVETLKHEALGGRFDRHDPSPLSWERFAEQLRDFLATVVRESERKPRGKRAAVVGPGGASTIGRVSNGHGSKKPVPKAPRPSGPRLLRQPRVPAPAPASRNESSDNGCLTVENAAAAAESFLGAVPSYPNDFAGRGIVICAGGVKYNTCAWVLVRLLRALDCSLPIEVWCYEHEYDAAWAALVEPFGALVRSAEDPAQNVSRRSAGWALKPLAVLKSAFREALLIDADNAPIRDPSYLFAGAEYQTSGTVFWPDHARTIRGTDQWRIFGVPYRDEREHESGQLLIDKAAAWRAVNLCAWYNRHADFFYRHTYGDKDTFRLAWQKTNTPYAMPEKDLVAGPRVLYQHDFAGEVLFQHRYRDKWNLSRSRRIPGFAHEALCFQFLRELRDRWRPPHAAWSARSAEATGFARQLAEELTGGRFVAQRAGHSRWLIQLGGSGLIEKGWTPGTEAWWLDRDRLILGTLSGEATFALDRREDGGWSGTSVEKGAFRLTLA